MSKRGLESKTELYRTIAIAAMSGLLADHVDMEENRKGDETCPECVARLACEQADAMLKELSK